MFETSVRVSTGPALGSTLRLTAGPNDHWGTAAGAAGLRTVSKFRRYMVGTPGYVIVYMYVSVHVYINL